MTSTPDPEPRRLDDPDQIRDPAFWAALPALPPPSSVLMVSPEHFEVRYAINPHMTDATGALNRVDRERAALQWDALRRAYEAIGYEVSVLEGRPDLPDMVFAANQAFPVPDDQGDLQHVLLSTMRHAERAPEVDAFAAWFAALGVPLLERDEAVPFEAHGDVLWHPRARLLLMGHGPRSSAEAWRRVSLAARAPVAVLGLVDPAFYHLDTCLVPLDAERALWVPAAFDAAGRALLAALFPRLIEVPETEARECFAANAHCPDGRHVLIDEAATETRRLVVGEGLRPLPVPTSEFRKAGGSVFCLKLMLPRWTIPVGGAGSAGAGSGA